MTTASLMNLALDSSLDGARGSLGNLKRAVALMGFDCATASAGNVITVTITHEGAKVACILARADRTDDAALAWTAV